MHWTNGAKLRAAIEGPLCRDLLRLDSQVIERPGWFQITTPSTRSHILNEVIVSEVDDASAEGAIDEVIRGYRAHGLPVKRCVGPWTKPADFGDRLARRGFRSWDVRGMACSTAAQLDVPGSVRVEPVTDESQADYDEAFFQGWQLAAEQKALLAAQHRELRHREPQAVHFFLATVEGRPAGTTGLIVRGDYSYFIGSQILEGYRGRGLYRALIEARLAFLRARSITLAVTHAREATSAPMLEHLGFETMFRSRCFVLDA